MSYPARRALLCLAAGIGCFVYAARQGDDHMYAWLYMLAFYLWIAALVLAVLAWIAKSRRAMREG